MPGKPQRHVVTLQHLCINAITLLRIYLFPGFSAPDGLAREAAEKKKKKKVNNIHMAFGLKVHVRSIHE